MEFEWNPRKAKRNQIKHDVRFDEALQVFADSHSLTAPDPDHSEAEQRFIIFGQTPGGRHLTVSFTERGGRIKLISARPMTPRERRAYEQW